MRWLDWIRRRTKEPDLPEPEFVVCETVAAISTHIREVGDRDLRLGGHTFPRPHTLCLMDAAWDTLLPIDSARCVKCVEKYREMKRNARVG